MILLLISTVNYNTAGIYLLKQVEMQEQCVKSVQS